MNFVNTKKTYYALWIPKNHYILQGKAVSFFEELNNKFELDCYQKILFYSKEEAVAFAKMILHDYVDRSDKSVEDKSWAITFDKNNKKIDIISPRKELGRLLNIREIPSSFCSNYRFLDSFQIEFDPNYSGVRLLRKTEVMLYVNKPEKKTIVVDGETYESTSNIEVCTNWYPYTDEEIVIVITQDEQMFIENKT
jgi:hypothetical protein